MCPGSSGTSVVPAALSGIGSSGPVGSGRPLPPTVTWRGHRANLGELVCALPRSRALSRLARALDSRGSLGAAECRPRPLPGFAKLASFGRSGGPGDFVVRSIGQGSRPSGGTGNAIHLRHCGRERSSCPGRLRLLACRAYREGRARRPRRALSTALVGAGRRGRGYQHTDDSSPLDAFDGEAETFQLDARARLRNFAG